MSTDNKEAVRSDHWMTGSATKEDPVVIFGDSRTRCIIGKAKHIENYPLGVLSHSGATIAVSLSTASAYVRMSDSPNRMLGRKAVVFNLGINNLLGMNENDYSRAISYQNWVPEDRLWKEELFGGWLLPFDEFRERYRGTVFVVSVVGVTQFASRTLNSGRRIAISPWAIASYNSFVDVFNTELSAMCKRNGWAYIDMGPHEKWTAFMNDGLHISYQPAGIPNTPKTPGLSYAHHIINLLRSIFRKFHL